MTTAQLTREAPAPPRDQITTDLADELIQGLGEAATEIANAYGPDNVVAWRLGELRRRVEQSERTKP